MKKPIADLTEKKGNFYLAEKIAVIYVVGMAIASVAAGYFFPVWGWGLSLTGGFSWPVAAAFALISLSGLVPFFQRALGNLLESLSTRFSSGLSPAKIFIAVLLAGLAAVVYLLPCPFMGDGLEFIYKAYPQAGATSAPHRHYPFLTIFYVWLHKFIQILIDNGLSIHEGAAARSYFVWGVFGLIAASVFIFALLKALQALSRKDSKAFIILVLVLTSGTMALFTGFIEVTPVFLAVLAIYLWLGLRCLDSRDPPWVVVALFFFILGLHASAVAIFPSLAYLLVLRKADIRKKPIIFIVGVVFSALFFLSVISRQIGLGVYFKQFVSGAEVIRQPGGAEKSYAYGLFSPLHLLELVNVLLLHNPLNLLLAGWVCYAAVFGWKEWIKDRQAVFFTLLLFSFTLLLATFNAFLGVLRDWDIYAPVSLLLPFTAWILWQAVLPGKARHRLTGIVAMLLPLSVSQLVLWKITLHSPDRLISKVAGYAKEKRFLALSGKQNFASQISLYCVENNYYPEYLLDFIGEDRESRQLILFRLARSKENIGQMLSLAERWKDKLALIDYANLGKGLINAGEEALGLYYLRLTTNRMAGDSLVFASINNLAGYYSSINRSPAAIYYYSLFPSGELESVHPELAAPFKSWKASGAYKDSVAALRRLAAIQVFNNGVSFLRQGKLETAEQEFIASLGLGFDSLRVKSALERIQRLKSR